MEVESTSKSKIVKELSTTFFPAKEGYKTLPIPHID